MKQYNSLHWCILSYRRYRFLLFLRRDDISHLLSAEQNTLPPAMCTFHPSFIHVQSARLHVSCMIPRSSLNLLLGAFLHFSRQQTDAGSKYRFSDLLLVHYFAYWYTNISLRSFVFWSIHLTTVCTAVSHSKCGVGVGYPGAMPVHCRPLFIFSATSCSYFSFSR